MQVHAVLLLRIVPPRALMPTYIHQSDPEPINWKLIRNFDNKIYLFIKLPASGGISVSARF
jgi:hypothetical protein